MMKPESKPEILALALALVALLIAGAAIVIANHFARPQREQAHALPGTRPAEQTLLPATPEKSGSPVPSGQTDALYALDESVLAIMNDTTLSNETKFAIFWDGYQKNKSNVTLSTYYIDCLSSIAPLPHIVKILAELSDPMTDPEIKNHLLRVLYYGYIEANGFDANSRQLALNAIKANIHHVDPTVAGEALVFYARMGVKDDWVALLGEALQRTIISPLEYLREGAAYSGERDRRFW